MTGRNLTKASLKKNKHFRKKVTWVFGGFVAVILVLPMIFGDMGFIPYVKMQRTQQNMEAELERLKTENQELEQRVQSLRSDSETIERIARQRLGLVRPGEVVFTFPDSGDLPGTPGP